MSPASLPPFAEAFAALLHSEFKIGKGVGWKPGTVQVKPVVGDNDGVFLYLSKDFGKPHFRWASTCGCNANDVAERKEKYDREHASGFSIDGVDALKRTGEADCRCFADVTQFAH